MIADNDSAEATEAPAVDFNGLAADFFLIQLGNLLLTIITFGIYRFWGKARYRRFLWSRTTLDGDPLEYTGTGFELFLGAILVILLVSIPVGVLSLVLPLVIPSKEIALFLTQFILILGIYWLIGVGQYRSWRYLFSRTAWRGIRSGMTGQGVAYGNFSFGLTLAQLFSFGLATPWTTTRRWNRLVRDVRIGSLPMASDATPDALWKPFLLVWITVALPLLAFSGWFAWRFGPLFAEQGPGPGDPAELLLAIGTISVSLPQGDFRQDLDRRDDGASHRCDDMGDHPLLSRQHRARHADGRTRNAAATLSLLGLHGPAHPHRGPVSRSRT